MAGGNVQVHFCDALTVNTEVVIVPVTATGFDYPMTTVITRPETFQELGRMLSYGNGVDFGLDGNRRHVFGIYTGWACNQDDSDLIYTALNHTFQCITQISANCKAVLVAPLGEDLNEIVCYNQNFAFFYYVVQYMQSGQLYICTKSVESAGLIKAMLGEVQGRVEVEIKLPVTRADFQKSFNGPFICIKCHEFAEDAMESSCCAEPACLICSRHMKKCPKCRNDPRWKESPLIRKKVAEYNYVCLCEESLFLKDLKQHRLTCDFSQFRCKLCSIGDTFGRKDFLAHLKETHSERLMADAMKNVGK